MSFHGFLFLYAAVDCGDLSAPSNGGVNIDGGTLYPTGKAVYQCNVGYELVGAVLDTRSCLSTGLWSGVEPMCTRKLLHKAYFSCIATWQFLISSDRR